ncbi:hypothetical protein NPIL_665201 [Nephila pilipes]|uniref:Uncharacterized protein n=1 Tax=Nephila pilipes TaxID=299642 RepID=A0A8X6IJR3_NEPPI|nr:hypothetical protein NPIL_665201 [Nephila pilipes]
MMIVLKTVRHVIFRWPIISDKTKTSHYDCLVFTYKTPVIPLRNHFTKRFGRKKKTCTEFPRIEVCWTSKVSIEQKKDKRLLQSTVSDQIDRKHKSVYTQFPRKAMSICLRPV